MNDLASLIYNGADSEGVAEGAVDVQLQPDDTVTVSAPDRRSRRIDRITALYAALRVSVDLRRCRRIEERRR